MSLKLKEHSWPSTESFQHIKVRIQVHPRKDYYCHSSCPSVICFLNPFIHSISHPVQKQIYVFCWYNSVHLQRSDHHNSYCILKELPSQSPTSTPASITIHFHITNRLILKTNNQIITVHTSHCKIPLHITDILVWEILCGLTSHSIIFYYSPSRAIYFTHFLLIYRCESSQEHSQFRTFALAVP